MISKVALCMLLLGSAAAQEKKASWWSSMKKKAFSSAKEAILADSDLIQSHALLKESKFSAKSCTATGHAMEVSETVFDIETQKLKVKGDLKRDVLGGQVSMKLKMGKAPLGLSPAQKFKRHLAWSVGAKKFASEDLCSHMGRQKFSFKPCPLKKGMKEMLFGLHKLPYTLAAGKYHLEVNAVDQAGEHIVCVQGELDVPRGPNGEVFRRLEEVSGAYRGATGLVALATAVLMFFNLM